MRYLASTLLALAAAPLLAAPEPSADALLAEARQAAGGAAWDKIPGLVAEGDEDSGGMRGHWRGIDDVKDGRMRRASDFGIIRSDEVWAAPDHWRQDISGGVHALDSDFARQVAATQAWLVRRDYLRPGHGGAALGPVETRRDGDRSFDIMAARPPGGNPIALWFDAGTHLLVRTHQALSINGETVSYGNYRKVDGLMLPFSIKTDDDNPDNVDTVLVTDYRAVSRFDPAAFAPPAAPDDTVVAGGKATLPIRFDGEIIVQALLNDKGPYSFILDTGGHDILTPDAAKALGLKPEGAGSGGGAGEGTLPQQYARVDTLQVGGVTMKNQPFFVIPLPYDTVDDSPRPPLAGILGLELFERMAIQIDYVGQTLTVQPLATYRHDGPGTAVPIRFYDDIPLVDAALDGHAGPFAIDTGNAGTLVAQHIWADRVGIGERMKQGLAMVSFGAGGQSRNWASRTDDFALGGTHLHGVIARYANDAKGAFSSRIEAGNVGNQVLAYFTVDFDYAHETLWLQPRPGFTALPFSRAGMSLYKDKPGAFTIVNILDNGPAAEAGLAKGDQITTIDGVAAGDLSRHDTLMMFTRAEGTKVAIDYRRDGRPRVTTLMLKTLLP